jgi:hypothetical protein
MITEPYLDQWLATLLANRADKSWSPILRANPETANALGTVAGFPIRDDNSLALNELQVDADVPPLDDDGNPVPNPMAVYVGISL